jgi:hypothetical protein
VAIARASEKNQDKAKGKVQKAKGKMAGKRHTDPGGAENCRAAANPGCCNGAPDSVAKRWRAAWFSYFQLTSQVTDKKAIAIQGRMDPNLLLVLLLV